MKFYSLNKQSPLVDFREATITGQAPDGGLYFPASVPYHEWLKSEDWKHEDLPEVAFRIMQPYVANTLPDDVLRKILEETLAFHFPLQQLNKQVSVLELFHGPTLAFKDVGARFMSRCLGFFNKGNNKKVTVLVATSGDTGGAVADGFSGIEGVEVIILYPKGKVSEVQELQLTTCGENVRAIRVSGSFDDCQAMVKKAFTDDDLKAKYQFSSANSINIARWLPQQLYYAAALQQWQYKTPPVISVPSGNFGNLCAGILLQRSGLDVGHFIAACNENDVIPHYLQTGEMEVRNTIATLSNAMDVAKPSNFIRIMEILGDKPGAIKLALSAARVSDEETISTMQLAKDLMHYTTDPHGAVALKALLDHLKHNADDKGIFLETAHPVKFPAVIEQALGQVPEVPASVKHLYAKKPVAYDLPAEYDAFKQYML